MFGIFGGNGNGSSEVKSNSSYDTGAPVVKTDSIYLLVDDYSETEVDKDYMDSLKADEAVIYLGPIEDTYGRLMYRYRLNRPSWV